MSIAPHATRLPVTDVTGRGVARGARALLSAHKAAAAQTGASPNTLPAIVAALDLAVASSVDFVEIDVHRTRDGHLVIQHDSWVRNHRSMPGQTESKERFRFSDLTRAQVEGLLGRGLVDFSEALRLFAERGVRAHLDFKFDSPNHYYDSPRWVPFEVEAAALALRVLGAGDRFILTTMEDHSVRAMREWADLHCPDVLIGLSLGRDLTTLNPWPQIRLRASELFPTARIQRCRANLVVANHVLANARLLAWAERNRLPILVWTVDSRAALNRFLADPRVWMVTTNHPCRAVA